MLHRHDQSPAMTEHPAKTETGYSACKILAARLFDDVDDTREARGPTDSRVQALQVKGA